MTAISHINNNGGIKSITCNNIAIKIHEFTIKNKFWISTAHIPSNDNAVGDELSRILNDATEWQLNPEHFTSVIKKFGKPDINVFASKINKK